MLVFKKSEQTHNGKPVYESRPREDFLVSIFNGAEPELPVRWGFALTVGGVDIQMGVGLSWNVLAVKREAEKAFYDRCNGGNSFHMDGKCDILNASMLRPEDQDTPTLASLEGIETTAGTVYVPEYQEFFVDVAGLRALFESPVNDLEFARFSTEFLLFLMASTTVAFDMKRDEDVGVYEKMQVFLKPKGAGAREAV